jgi:glycosyltransferase involved in cell wall biosynthesis
LKVSIVTPTYNRKEKIEESINSSLNLIKEGYVNELVIVDDASTDETFAFIQDKYSYEINAKQILLYRLERNIGVTGAKNKGTELASGDWMVFMDSDDCFLDNIGKSIYDELNKNDNYDLLFFRCIDKELKKLIGPEKKSYDLTLSELINNGTPGECLPVVRKSVMLSHPYPAKLRGCESLSYFSILEAGLKAFVSDLIVRQYDSTGTDRLSMKKSIIKRSDKLLEYHFKSLKYWNSMQLKTFFGKIIRIIYYTYLRLSLVKKI